MLPSSSVGRLSRALVAFTILVGSTTIPAFGGSPPPVPVEVGGSARAELPPGPPGDVFVDFEIRPERGEPVVVRVDSLDIDVLAMLLVGREGDWKLTAADDDRGLGRGSLMRFEVIPQLVYRVRVKASHGDWGGPVTIDVKPDPGGAIEFSEDEEIAYWKRLFERAEERDLPRPVTPVAIERIESLIELGRFGEAEAAAGRVLRAHEESEIGETFGLARLELLRAILHMERGAVPEAVALLRRSLRIAEERGASGTIFAAHCRMTLASLLLRGPGADEEVERLLRRADEILRSSEDVAVESRLLAIRALAALLISQDRIEETMALVEPGVRIVRDNPDVEPSLRVKILSFAALSQAVSGTPEVAEEYVGEAVGIVEEHENVDPGSRIQCRRWASQIFALRGKLAEAEEHARRSLEVASRHYGWDDQRVLAIRAELEAILAARAEAAE